MMLTAAIKRIEEDTNYKLDILNNKAVLYEVMDPSYYLKRITTLTIEGYEEGALLEDITFKDIHNDQRFKGASYEGFKSYIESLNFKGW